MHEIMSTQKERRFSFTRHNCMGGNSLVERSQMEPQCPQQNQTGYSTCSATSVDKSLVGGWVAK